MGIPTLSLTSAFSITRSVNPPRAAFVDFPLGHTAGRPDDPLGQHALLTKALAAFEGIDRPGTIVDLGEYWGDDDWRADPMGGGRGGGGGGGDTRTQRHDTPQYQSEEDARAAAARLGEDVACRACAVFDA
ncbi:MAG: hypothetical protein GEV08_00920 [Acidimicrobiia bacterium]|nr:hypothetical protein [Acidimicrobiia bacterium]